MQIILAIVSFVKYKAKRKRKGKFCGKCGKGRILGQIFLAWRRNKFRNHCCISKGTGEAEPTIRLTSVS